MSSSSFCIFWKKFPLILCLNVFGLLADFKLDGYSIFLVRGKMSIFVQKYFWEMEAFEGLLIATSCRNLLKLQNE